MWYNVDRNKKTFWKDNKNDEQKSPRTFEEILSDIIDGFIKASPRQKKNVMKILKAAADKKQ